MAEGVDYSFDRPTPAELKAAGKRFACRYIGTPSSGKNLTKAEADALQAAGIDIVANYEGFQAGWMSGGWSVGVAAAKNAHADAVNCGMPPDRPIYFSADYNATYDQYKTQIRPCLQGAASVIGTRRVGIYGGIEQVDWAYGDGIAPWVWQTYAWSYGTWSKHAKIQQYRNGVTLGSGTVDLDRSLVADYGQWSAQEDDVTQDEHDALMWLRNNVVSLRDQGVRMTDHGDPNVAGRSNHLAQVRADIAALQADVDTLKQAQDPAALAALLAGQLEITGITTDPGGVVSVQFGPKAPA